VPAATPAGGNGERAARADLVDAAVLAGDERVAGDEVHVLDVGAVDRVERARRDLPDADLGVVVLIEDALGGACLARGGTRHLAGGGQWGPHHVDGIHVSHDAGTRGLFLRGASGR